MLAYLGKDEEEKVVRKYWLPVSLIVVDIITLVIVAFLSLYIRFEGDIATRYIDEMLTVLPLFVCSYLIMMGLNKMYTRVWRYAGMKEVVSVVMAATAGAILFYLLTWWMGVTLPRSIYIISYVLSIGGLGVTRMLLHYVSIQRSKIVNKLDQSDENPTLIIGAGDAGAILARELDYYHKENHKIVGFIDDDEAKKGQILSGFPILGSREDIADIVRKNYVREIIVAMPSVDQATIRTIVNLCAPLHCKIKTLPGVYQILSGEVLVSRLRDVSIEDLLARDEIVLDKQHIAEYLTGKVILISGAGGSIGSEICRQVMKMNPKKLILMGHGENSIYLIHKELANIYGTEKLAPVIASIRDPHQLDMVFAEYRPQVVFHAAAHKHVPLMEIQPMAAVTNNIFGTRNMAEVAGRYGVERFVMISTDKAVNPTNVMGATKQVAEKVVHMMNDVYDTKYITVRFGNVLGSRGSVIPLFRKQIAAGGPVTVTDAEMMRYFMTIPEAAQLVMQAGSMGKGGEVFLLDMGKPVKIIDLARNMIRLSGFEPDKDVKIKITGLRPGEKLYEELLTAGEGTGKTTHKKIFTAPLEKVDVPFLQAKLDEFQYCKTDMDIITILKALIPTYHPNHEGKNHNL